MEILEADFVMTDDTIAASQASEISPEEYKKMYPWRGNLRLSLQDQFYDSIKHTEALPCPICHELIECREIVMHLFDAHTITLLDSTCMWCLQVPTRERSSYYYDHVMNCMFQLVCKKKIKQIQNTLKEEFIDRGLVDMDGFEKFL